MMRAWRDAGIKSNRNVSEGFPQDSESAFATLR